jgi:hypothetical protein
MYSLNQQGIAIFAEVYIRQKKKVLYLCGKLKTYNHGIFPSVDLAHHHERGVREKSFPITHIYEYADENEC